MLQIRNLTKIYEGGVKALDNVSFDVPDGQFLAVIGLSGSGKSTLLRCINRLIEPTDGQILWNGEDITKASPEEMRRVRRKIGMVFQHFNLVHRSKVITNVLAGRLGYINPAWSLLNRFPKDDIQKALRQLERVGIADKANHRADELSGGQQQRVAIARALLLGADLLLADEPTGNLDPASSQTILDLFAELAHRGRTIVLVTHDPAVAARASRRVQMSAGRVVHDTVAN
jgi:phosphonate transport system ATP-binding protein